jgi:hypothetical protein
LLGFIQKQLTAPPKRRGKVREGMRELHEAAETLILEALGEDCDVLEAWSDAARQASIAARQAKAKGGDWRKAGRKAYFTKVGARTFPDEPGVGTYRAVIRPVVTRTFAHPDLSNPRSGRRRVYQWDAVAHDPSGSVSVSGSGRTPGEAQQAARAQAADVARGWRSVSGTVSRSLAKKYLAAGRTFSKAGRKPPSGGMRLKYGPGDGSSRKRWEQ